MCIKNMLLHDHMRMSRFGLAIGSFLWGIQLIAPSSIFPTAAQIAAGTGRVTYTYMAMIAPEHVWGFLFLIHSAWALYTLSTNVKNHMTLAVDGFLGCLL